MKIVKGKLVRINVAKCFTKANGGQLIYPFENYKADKGGFIHGVRTMSQDDFDKLAMSKGLDTSGEPKLTPTCHPVRLYRDRVYPVLRARCAPNFYHRRTPGMMLVLDTVDGHEVYIKRDLMEAVDEG